MVQKVFAAAGAAPVNLPGSEVYTSLEKGVIDAADYTLFSVNQQQGMHKIGKYPVFPGFHSMPLQVVTINKDIWNELPESIQTMMETASGGSPPRCTSSMKCWILRQPLRPAPRVSRFPTGRWKSVPSSVTSPASSGKASPPSHLSLKNTPTPWSPSCNPRV
ncbi:MAG: hypothetical protein JKP90_20630 [Desulfofustis sp. PB-SRB1]|nr:hypothetical protein [Desulfofustis sp. PB-SRB1]